MTGKRGKLAQRKKATMEQPRDEWAGDEEKQEASDSIEMQCISDSVPHALGRRAVYDGDLANLASVGCAGIDHARAVLTEDAVVAIVQR